VTTQLGSQRTVKEAAERLNLSPATIRAWMSQRRLGFVRLGRSVRVPDAEIERVLEDGYRPPEQLEEASPAPGAIDGRRRSPSAVAPVSARPRKARRRSATRP
jgi:excisionase family DNA binding protein